MLKISQKVISPEAARELILKEQGLVNVFPVKGKKGALSIIQKLGYLQIDTLNVIARSHHHTLWSRLPDYEETFLNELLIDKYVFEYWSHAASYLPMNDYRFSLPLKKSYADGKSHWFKKDKKMNAYVLDKIKAEGPLQSKDFEFKRNSPGNWYNWKPAKQALEQLFMEGKLMVAQRQNFQKVYDLTERIIPHSINISYPTKSELATHFIKRAIQAYGIVNEHEITYLRKGLKEVVTKEIKKKLKEGELINVIIEKNKKSYITTPRHMQEIELSNKGVFTNKLTKNIHFLSPFDNAVIQRKRLNSLFGFDFAIECYLPESKRQYGYWCLPILYNSQFVGRIDTKADRASKIFQIKSIHFEEKFETDDEFNDVFIKKMKAFAAFNSCDKINIQKADKVWKKQILSKL